MRLLKVLSIIASVIVGLQTFAQPNIPSYVPSNGLVGYWPFNGNADDESGNGNHGVVHGATLASDRFGASNKSYNFSSDSIAIANSSSFDLGEFTITGWIKTTSNSSYYQTMFSHCRDVSPPTNQIISGYWLGLRGSKATFFLSDGQSGGVDISSVQDVNDGNWHFLTGVYSGGIGKVFVDGIQIDSLIYPMFITPSTPTTIGGDVLLNNEYFEGDLDDIAIFNRALTQQEITNLYTRTPPVSCLPSYVPTNGLLGYWPFCGNADDESGNGNHGVVHGAALTSDRFGASNKSYNFSSDSIAIPNSSSFDLGEFTITGWIKTISNSSYYQTMFSHCRDVSPPTNQIISGYWLGLRGSKATFFLSDGQSGGVDISSVQDVNDGNWHFLTGVYSGGIGKVFVDGIQIDSLIYPMLITPSTPTTIGGDVLLNNEYFEGNLDDIGIWNRALSQQEITNLYQGFSPFNIVSSATSTCAGQPVTLSVTALPGTVSGLNCSSATNTGSLVAGAAASNVSSTIPYTGGNGGLQNGQTVSSTGVTGLTATLSGGVLNTGNGNLIYTITGTPSAAGTASFALNIGGQTCTLTLTVYGTQPAYPVGSVFCNGVPTIVNDVTNPITGKVWMDRNLGASQVATSSTDANSYGDLYQWGRGSDGHQCRNSATSSTLSSTDQPGNGNFILGPSAPYDWHSPQNNNLWQGTSGVNNPCPGGYRLPSETEINVERLSWLSNNPTGAATSILKLPAAGGRSYNNGSLANVGSDGAYWSGTISAFNASALGFFGSGAEIYSYYRGDGYSVRCIKEFTAGNLGAINCGTATNTGTLISTIVANGVSSSIPYTGANAGLHNGQTVTSTGVTGLTATLAAGSFANGAGTLVYNITGTPSTEGTSSFAINIGGQTCTLTFTVSAIIAAQYPVGSIFCAAGPTAIVDVTNPITGKVWMDRNLGASQVATSSTDAAAYGDLYQWGRGSDGHQCRSSATTSTLSSSDQPGHGDFILSAAPSVYDWRSPQNINLWQGVNGMNNPCPTGYRVPTNTELDIERLCWISNNPAGAFASTLKFPLAGYRHSVGGSINSGFSGSYWSSAVLNTMSRNLMFIGDDYATLGANHRAFGQSVRCIKEDNILPGITGTILGINCSSATSTGSLMDGVAATEIISIVPYTGGNGGLQNGQTVSSTGVTGLTATLSGGVLNTGNGNLIYIITGTPSGSGAASFALNIGGQTCTLTINVSVNFASYYPPGSIFCSSVATIVNDVLSYNSGKTWMDRNLGASQVATSRTDAAAYGDLYQWGRGSDGHQCRTSSTTTTLSSLDQPENPIYASDFISGNSAPYDWRSPQNDNLWQGVNGINNPCPNGYRLPTKQELLVDGFIGSPSDLSGDFTTLKLPLAGYRDGPVMGMLNDAGTSGNYWSSTINGSNSTYLSIGTMLGTFDSYQYRNYGLSVRCIKN